MDESLVQLIAASTAFVGTHFALSHPLRAPLVRMLGDNGFMALYSVVALACLYWMSEAFKAAAAASLGGSGIVGWIVASALTVAALVLLLGSFRANPALPASGAENIAATREPTGVFAVTRHPMMWAFALWSVSHVVLWWSWRTNVVAIAVLILALVGAHLQDRKKEALMGEAWTTWEAKTRYWPRWGKLLSAGWALWLAAILAWLGITWMHLWLAGIPAGAWRWL
ncbi:NnrU family protein [Aurantiacibacter odishensis]|uniref:NnrU family protein n=1 Tax=Aurantiacibacter odishensis TaxID=1155476 RepID=UPI000E757913|nr:NnrU family protein [Aurantiacibacter odishensis]